MKTIEDFVNELCGEFGPASFRGRDRLRAALREIRNDALEESATRIEVIADMDKDYGGDPSGRRDLRLLCAGMVRALKDTSAPEAAGKDAT